MVRNLFLFLAFWLGFSLLIGGQRWRFPMPLKQSLLREKQEASRLRQPLMRFQPKKQAG
jgi:hypothetical protein